MAPVLTPLAERLAARTGARVEVIAVENRLFGPTVTTAGLLAGADIAAAASARGPWDIVLLPAEALNDDMLFIDSMPLADVERAFAGARVLPAHEITAALAAT
jgi:NifB/MoaA-like Fe-S oxidoreductase